MKAILPQSVKACLWSYNIDMLDFSIPDHRTRVIRNVLNRGSVEAVQWLRNTFSDIEIKDTIIGSTRSDWSKKSLALWVLIFNVPSLKEGRFS